MIKKEIFWYGLTFVITSLLTFGWLSFAVAEWELYWLGGGGLVPIAFAFGLFLCIPLVIFSAFEIAKSNGLSFLVLFITMVSAVLLVLGCIYIPSYYSNKKQAEFWANRIGTFQKMVEDLPTSVDITKSTYNIQRNANGGYDFEIIADTNIRIVFDEASINSGIHFFLNDVKGTGAGYDDYVNYQDPISGCLINSGITKLVNGKNDETKYPPGKYSIHDKWNMTNCNLTGVLKLSGQKVYVRGSKGELIKVVSIGNIQINNNP